MRETAVIELTLESRRRKRSKLYQIRFTADENRMRAFLFISISIFVFWFVGGSAPAHSEDTRPCLEKIKIEYETAYGNDLEVQVASSREAVDRQLDRDGSVAIGIRADGHAYLTVGGKRFHGSPLKVGFYENKGASKSGYVFKLDGIPEQQRAVLIKRFVNEETDGYELSCIHAACSLLKKDTGAEVHRNHPSVPTATQIYKDLVRNGFVANDGTPLQMTIIRMSDRDRIEGLGHAMLGKQVAYVAIVGIIGGASGALVLPDAKKAFLILWGKFEVR